MKFGFVAKHRGAWPVNLMCEALGVSRGGFYEWLKRPQSNRSRQNEQLTVQIRTSFERSDRTYGSIRVTRDLHDWGFACGHNRVARLMLMAGLKARHKHEPCHAVVAAGKAPVVQIASNADAAVRAVAALKARADLDRELLVLPGAVALRAL